MARYRSIDTLQKALGEGVFSYAKDKKKAAGRALGTFVETIAFYLLKSWGFERSVAIERGIPEYENLTISHNVEFSLHRSRSLGCFAFSEGDLPLSSSKICKAIDFRRFPGGGGYRKTGQRLLGADGILKNACTIAELDGTFLNAYRARVRSKLEVEVRMFPEHAVAMFECKRVGVEEGQKKGPQTIEKAKQGAYVARTVSSLQRFRSQDGSLRGIAERNDGSLVCDDYYTLLDRVVNGLEPDIAKRFMLTVGIVSNHGNWFTSGNRNKELEVLAQSYDWLLFLTDEGLAQFIEDVVFSGDCRLTHAAKAFRDSYGPDANGGKPKNRFTKSSIDELADMELAAYFNRNAERIASWFNLITPERASLVSLREQLGKLVAIDEEKVV